MHKHQLLGVAIAALLGVGAAPSPRAAVLSEVSALMRASSSSDEAYGQAIRALQATEAAACVGDAAGDTVCGLIGGLLSDYQRVQELVQSPAVDLAKLKKALDKANKKKSALRSEEDTHLESKADKLEREKANRKADAAIKKAEAAISQAEQVAAAKTARHPLLSGLRQLVPQAQLPVAGKLQVLSEAPMVLVLDDWLGTTTSAALTRLGQVMQKTLNPVEGGGSNEIPPQLPLNASALDGVPATAYVEDSSPEGQKPRLCIPINGSARAQLLASIQQHIDAAKAAKSRADGASEERDAGGYCDVSKRTAVYLPSRARHSRPAPRARPPSSSIRATAVALTRVLPAGARCCRSRTCSNLGSHPAHGRRRLGW